MADRIQLRRDTAANWTSVNPTLASGELGLETDTGKLKLGTGALAWNSLSYYTLATTGYAPLASPTFTGTATAPTVNASTALQIGGAAITATAAELNYSDGVTSNIQTQLDAVPSPKITATASGAIANGDTVCVNAAGTVSAITGSSATEGLGAIQEIGDPGGGPPTSCYDTVNNRVIQMWTTSGIHVRVGTVTGGSTNTISWGADSHGNSGPDGSTNGTFPSCCYDSNAERVVVVFKDSTQSTLAANVGTVDPSNNTISWGTKSTVMDSTPLECNVVYDENAEKVAFFYGQNSPLTGKTRVGTVDPSNNSLSYGDELQFQTGRTYPGVQSSAYDPIAEKIVFIWRDSSENIDGAVFTISGTDISHGTIVTVATNNCTRDSLTCRYDPDANKTLMSWKRQSSSYNGQARVGTISGTDLQLGDIATYSYLNQSISGCSMYDESANKHVIIFQHSLTGDNQTYVTIGTISGTDVTFTDPVNITAETSTTYQYGSLLFDPDTSRGVFVWKEDADNVQNSQVWTTGFFNSNVTAENYIGIADAAYADTVTATIQTVGAVDDAQSSLTPGQAYYVQADGSLSTTAASTSIFAGTAIAATKLIVKG